MKYWDVKIGDVLSFPIPNGRDILKPCRGVVQMKHNPLDKRYASPFVHANGQDIFLSDHWCIGNGDLINVILVSDMDLEQAERLADLLIKRDRLADEINVTRDQIENAPFYSARDFINKEIWRILDEFRDKIKNGLPTDTPSED